MQSYEICNVPDCSREISESRILGIGKLRWGFRVWSGSFLRFLLVWPFDPTLRRFEHDFVSIAGLTLSDPARGPLRAGSWVSLRRKIARRPTGPVSFGHFSLRVQRKVTRVQGGAPGRGRRGRSPLAWEYETPKSPSIPMGNPEAPLRFLEGKGRSANAQVLTVTKNEILCSMNKPDYFILAIVQFDGPNHSIHSPRRPFQKEPDFGAASVNYNFADLLSRTPDPA
jgi:hypothetical protein